MCRLCDNPNPDGDAEKDLEGLREAVRAHGWVIKCDDEGTCPYAYTIGLHELGLPELLATGVTTDRALALLDYFTNDAIVNGPPAPGDRIVLSDTAMIEAVQVDHPAAYMDLAVALFGPDLRAVQLVWTDLCGRWPWDAAFDYDGVTQPVLGMRAQNA
jgi:hypothetical protein